MTDSKSKSFVAYHEVGHAVCVMLVPRGQARGLTWFIPSDDHTLISKQQFFARIVGGLGGRAAEEIILVSLRLLLERLATCNRSPVWPSSDVIMRMMARNSMSEKLAEDNDSVVKKLAYEIALSHIRNNCEAMDKIVEVLLEKETIGGDEFRVPASTTTSTPTPASV
ncbi:LOW QUALITY PROTEIN: hypothetical protein N665_0089s0054 [Sinapis alba]|nr:LOW QUALITY PROTEIN: hypothetical protein N665_0089s0054 [Sinapis alba]